MRPQQSEAPAAAGSTWPAPLAALAVLTVGLWAIGAAPAGVFYDDGIYLSLGQALSMGAGFRYLNLPGAPAAIHYPPGYPTLLAVCWWLGSDLPRVLLLAKVLNAVLMAASAGGLVWLLSSVRAAAPLAAVGVVAGALAVPVLAVSTIPFSEPLFLALLVASAISTGRALEPDAGIRNRALAGLTWGSLFLVRSLGAAVVPVGLLLLVRHSGRRAAGIAAAATLAVTAPWILWSARHASDVPAILSGSYGSYPGWYAESVAREGPGLVLRIAGHNLVELARPLGVLLAPPGPSWLGWLVIPAGLVILLLGVLALARASALLAGTLGLYLLTVVIWPYPPDRFIWGMWPVITAALALGFAELWRRRERPARQRQIAMALLGLGLAGVAGYAVREGSGLARRSWEGPQRSGASAMEPVVKWVRAHVPEDAVVATENDPLLYLYTGRKAVPVLSWTATEHVGPQTPAQAEANLGEIQEQFAPAWIILPGGGTPEAVAVERMWREEKRLELVDTLQGGGAVFRPVRPASTR
jgi:hypothetical protein